MKNPPKVFTDKEELSRFLDNPTQSIAEAFVGIMKADKGQHMDAGMRLFNAMLKKRPIEQLMAELERYRKAGIVKNDFLETDYNRMALKEVFRIIDEDPPDADKFKAVKSLFLCNVEKDATEGDQLLTYQYLKLIRPLESGEILLLKTAWETYQGKQKSAPPEIGEVNRGEHPWFKAMARQSGLKHPALVGLYFQRLLTLGLTNEVPRSSQAVHVSLQGLPNAAKPLTSLGESLCEFIIKYN